MKEPLERTGTPPHEFAICKYPGVHCLTRREGLLRDGVWIVICYCDRCDLKDRERRIEMRKVLESLGMKSRPVKKKKERGRIVVLDDKQTRLW